MERLFRKPSVRGANAFFLECFDLYFKKSKMDFPLYFQKVMLLWQGSIVEIDYMGSLEFLVHIL